MALAGVDIVSVDWTVDMAGSKDKTEGANIGVQGNLDPCALFGSKNLSRSHL